MAHNISPPIFMSEYEKEQAESVKRVLIINDDSIASLPLNIPTPDDNPSLGHTSIIETPNCFMGHKYWMAFTPYPGAARENPCVVCSNNKSDWVVPRGLTNPIFDLGVQGYGNNSDTHIMFNTNYTKLMIYFRAVKPTTEDEAIFLTTTTDGVNWSDPIRVVNVVGSNTRGIMSPVVRIEDDGTYTMWSVNQDAADQRNFVEKRTSSDGEGKVWSDPVPCTVPSGNATLDYSIYHIEVRKFNGVYYMLASCVGVLTLRFLISYDGINYVFSSSVPLSGFEWDKNLQYRSTFLPVQSNPVKFDLWITGIKLGTTNAWANDAVWRVGYLKGYELYGNPGKGTPTLSFMRSGKYYGAIGPNSNCTINNGDLLVSPIFVPRKLSISKIGLQVITQGSAGALINLGIYADDGNGAPGSLVLDAGTIDGTVLGFTEKTIDQVLESGVYWIGALLLGNPSTKPIVRGCGETGLSIGFSDPTDAAAACYRYSGQTALPLYFSGSVVSPITPRVMIKIA